MKTRRDLLATTLRTAAGVIIGGSGLTAFAAPRVKSLDLTPGDVCTLTCQQTLGPCHYDGDLVRRNITEGKPGLPTLMSFLVVDADTCEPVPDASVEIWHTDANGVYSAPINTFCNPNDPVARTQTFARGIQPVDDSGWAHFDSFYPGWYPGRTTHIHATIRRGTAEMVTTQFYFPDALSEWVYRNHPTYTHRPNRNTTNTTDGIIGGSASRVTPYLFTSKLIQERALVALKVVAIRGSRTTCNV